MSNLRNHYSQFEESSQAILEEEDDQVQDDESETENNTECNFIAFESDYDPDNADVMSSDSEKSSSSKRAGYTHSAYCYFAVAQKENNLSTFDMFDSKLSRSF